ncbi:MAG TPA: hypothetical protein VFD30_03490 [Terriglobia bacterium]|nr:hypothetical protein [Terriglobia bacterium]
MSLPRSCWLALLVLLAGATLSSPAMATGEKTIFSFDKPVEIPGRVLPRGTYVFQLLDPGCERNIVQIFNKDQSKLVATLVTVPDYRLVTKGKTVITFENRGPHTPEAIKAWFYPGRNYGQEFLYSISKAPRLAGQTNKRAAQ